MLRILSYSYLLLADRGQDCGPSPSSETERTGLDITLLLLAMQNVDRIPFQWLKSISKHHPLGIIHFVQAS